MSPLCSPAMCVSHIPSGRRVQGEARGSQRLKSPITLTALALGAQRRKRWAQCFELYRQPKKSQLCSSLSDTESAEKSCCGMKKTSRSKLDLKCFSQVENINIYPFYRILRLIFKHKFIFDPEKAPCYDKHRCTIGGRACLSLFLGGTIGK